MTTTTKVDGITIHDDGEDRETTHYTSDDDLSVNIRKGWTWAGGHQQGVVLVQLGIDDYPGVHSVALEHYQCLGTPVEVLDLAIRQLEKGSPRAEPHRGRGSTDRDRAQRILARRRC